MLAALLSFLPIQLTFCLYALHRCPNNEGHFCERNVDVLLYPSPLCPGPLHTSSSNHSSRPRLHHTTLTCAPSSAAPMLRPPEHQVAGHQARDGQLGPLVDSSGRFYKPLQGNERGDCEAAFYASFSTDPRVPPHVRRFFPGFHGTLLLPASDGRGPYPHLVLDNLLAPYVAAPSVADLKIGARTWAPTAPDDYLHKCLKKDRESTSLSLGFRLSGIQIHQGSGSGCYKPDRGLLKSFGTADVKRVLRQFVSSNPVSDPIPDCALASLVYGGSEGILAQLLELKAWFEDQTLFHFFAASALMVYDRDGAAKGNGRPMVWLVDFAHVMEGNGVIDHNFLGGLCSMIKFISEILTGPEEEEEASKLCLANGA